MKYLKKKQTNRALIITIIALSVVLAVLIGLLVWLELGETDDHPAQTQPSDAPVAAPEDTGIPNTQPAIQSEPIVPPPVVETEPLPQDLVVMTPYCNLYYPGEWAEAVRAEVTSSGIGCIITWFATVGDHEAELFIVYIADAGPDSIPIGFITHDGVSMDVSVETSDFTPDSTWEADEADQISAMQEGLNYLIQKLKEHPAFSTDLSDSDVDETEATEATIFISEDLIARTPLCDLYFPAQWKDVVTWDGEETAFGYIASFHATVNGKEALLFRVCFADAPENSFPVGILEVEDMWLDVSIETPELSDDESWSDLDKEMFYTLQEQLNYLLEKLNENHSFMPVEG